MFFFSSDLFASQELQQRKSEKRPWHSLYAFYSFSNMLDDRTSPKIVGCLQIGMLCYKNDIYVAYLELWRICVMFKRVFHMVASATGMFTPLSSLSCVSFGQVSHMDATKHNGNIFSLGLSDSLWHAHTLTKESARPFRSIWKRICWGQLPHMEAATHKDLWCFGCRPNWVHMFPSEMING